MLLPLVNCSCALFPSTFIPHSNYYKTHLFDEGYWIYLHMFVILLLVCCYLQHSLLWKLYFNVNNETIKANWIWHGGNHVIQPSCKCWIKFTLNLNKRICVVTVCIWQFIGQSLVKCVIIVSLWSLFLETWRTIPTEFVCWMTVLFSFNYFPFVSF